MMVLIHIDWGGTEAQLKELDEAYKKNAEKTEGVTYKGRLVPWNKKYHFTYVLKMDNISMLYAFGQNWDRTRDYSQMTHGEYEIYG